MVSKINSSNLIGINGHIVNVELDITNGIPCFNIVGLASKEIRESKERVKSSIINSGYKFPNSRIIVNLSPADMKKEGSFLDLPIAISILRQNIKRNDEYLHESVFIGELSLDGILKRVNGVLPIIISAKEKGIKRIFIPYNNILEARLIEDIEIIPIKTLNECIEYLNEKINIDKIKTEEILENEEIEEDFSQVYGNYVAKRCAEIAAAGNHNMFMIGQPGSGKTMIAKRIPTILPKLEKDEILDISKIYSSVGMIEDNEFLIRKRPFRSPHHTITSKSLIGGGYDSKCGEVVLAHKGVLFLDEIAEFDKKLLDTLRQPIEDKKVTISRLKYSIEYPCDVLIVAAMNPCPCGNYKTQSECSCNVYQVNRYLNKVSGPLLDRFDLFVELNPISHKELQNGISESTKDIRYRVNKAKEIQKNRFTDKNIRTNDDMKPHHINEFCKIDKKTNETLDLILSKYKLTNRSYYKLIKVARTISDLEGCENINSNHIMEAFGYRKAYYKYFGDK